MLEHYKKVCGEEGGGFGVGSMGHSFNTLGVGLFRFSWRSETISRNVSRITRSKMRLHYGGGVVKVSNGLVDYLSLLPPLFLSNLWLFVSKFTPSQPQKLYKIYKKTKKERGKEVSHILLETTLQISPVWCPF